MLVADWDPDEPWREFCDREATTKEVLALQTEHNRTTLTAIRDVARALRKHVEEGALDRVLARMRELQLSYASGAPLTPDTICGAGCAQAQAQFGRQVISRTVMPEENSMDPSPVLELNAFVPAKDFDLSKQFYSDLGFELVWGNSDIAQFQIGSFTFLLQNFYKQQHAENFMMSLMVEDADRWWNHIERIGLRGKYPRIMLKPPEMQPWGIRVLYVSDPTGVLWHIADRKKE